MSPEIIKDNPKVDFVESTTSHGTSQLQYYKDLQEEYNAILESSYDGIFIADGEGVVLRLNKACERIDEVKAEDIVGRHLQELVNAGIYSESVTLKVLESRKRVTILQKTKSGKEILATGTPIFKDGKIFRVVVNSRDITELNNLKNDLHQAFEKAEILESELNLLRSESIKTDEFVSRNHKMRKIYSLAARVAVVDSTILIQGETGVGKEVITKFIHRSSKRKDGPFIKIDCSSIPENLLESELFGYEKGSFTGANKQGKVGLIELANGGTLFLDEIGELPQFLQAKLLRFIQDREIIRIGGVMPISVDIRIIAATNKDLKAMVEQKFFREDLYYRLNVIPIIIPPLRQRPEDIQPLVTFFLNKFNNKYGYKKKIRPEALRYLIEYDWPGNVRELENLIERLVVTTSADTIEVEDLPNTIINYKTANYGDLPLEESVANFEKQLILNVLRNSKSTLEMADKLKIDVSTVRRKLKKYKIDNPFTARS
jgi:PAS domain S-box-containing protein